MPSFFKSSQERLREHQLFISRSCREIDRLRVTLEAQERGILNQVRQAGRRRELTVARILARQLVVTRRHVHRFYRMGCELASLGLRLQGLRSTEAIGEAMRGVAEMMGALNAQFGLREINDTLVAFEHQSQVLGLRQEAMDLSMDSVMGDPGDAQAVDAEVAGLLGELDIPLESGGAPTRAEDVRALEVDLQKRLQTLVSRP